MGAFALTMIVLVVLGFIVAGTVVAVRSGGRPRGSRRAAHGSGSYAGWSGFSGGDGGGGSCGGDGGGGC